MADQCQVCARAGKSPARSACRMTCGGGHQDTPWVVGPFGEVPPAGLSDIPQSADRHSLSAVRAATSVALVPASPPPKA